MTAIQAALKYRPASVFDIERVRADFPILKLKVGGKPLVYLDNAASSQMPQPVIDRLVRYQRSQHANIHRGVHYLSETATGEYEEARRKLQRFKVAATSRASFAFYNTLAEVDALIVGIRTVQKVFS